MEIVFRHQVMRFLKINPLDAFGRHKLLDIDSFHHIESDSIQILISQNDVVILFPLSILAHGRANEVKIEILTDTLQLLSIPCDRNPEILMFS